MEVQQLVVLGAGGLAREAAEIIEAMNDESINLHGFAKFELLGFISPSIPSLQNGTDRTQILGDDDYLKIIPKGTKFVACIGNGYFRARAAHKAELAGLTPVTLIHPKASIAKQGVEIGPGTIIGALATLSCDVRVGAHVLIDRGVSIAHDCTVADFVSLFGGASLAGNVELETHATIGTRATVIQNIHIGKNAFVGAGAVVIRKVDANQTVAGNPAKEVKK